MTSKSFSSKGLLGNSMRRSLWALVLSGVGFFLSLLLPALMTMQNALEQRARDLKELSQASVELNWQNAMNNAASMLSGGNLFVKIVFIVLAVVCGVAMFAYLHSRQKVDFYHSLPISRTRLFANNFLTGVVCTFSTYLVMLAITVGCAYAMGCGEAVRWDEIGGAVLCNLIVFLLIYALTVLTTVICGNTIITLLLLAWVFFSPMLVRVLQFCLFDKFYDTFTANAGQLVGAIRLTPVVQYFVLHGTHYIGEHVMGVLQPGESALGLLIGYLIAAAVVTALALFLFRIRKSERAGTALAFTPTKLPIKVYMCLVMGVAFGWVFGMIAGNFWFWPGLVVGTVLFHWIVEIIYAFDFRAIFAKPLHLLAILVVLVAGMLAMQFDVTGYDTWLPDRDDLTAVDISGSGEPALTDPSNIDAVHRLMEIGVQAMQEEDTDEDNSLSYTQVTVKCQMGSRTAARQYMLPETEEVIALLDQIEQSEEYKRAKWPLFNFDTASTDSERQPMITVNVETADGISSVELRQPGQITQVIETLREEALAGTQDSRPVMDVELYYLDSEGDQEHCGTASVTEANTKTLALIEQLTGLTPVPMRTEDISSLQIGYQVSIGQDASEWRTIEVTDPADIQALLDNAFTNYLTGANGYRYANGENYTVDIYVVMETGEQRHLCYLQSDWPSEIIDKYRPDGAGEDALENGIATTAEAVS